MVVDSDTSNLSVDAVLSQIQDGQERVIMYWSEVLIQKSEELLCIPERTAGICTGITCMALISSLLGLIMEY